MEISTVSFIKRDANLYHTYTFTYTLKEKSSPLCASVLLITMRGPLMWTLPKFRMFRIFLNINSISYSFRSIANQNGVRYSDSTSYFKKYSSSKCKQTVCLHYGLDFPFNTAPPTIYIHELVVRARQQASVAQLVRALHRNRRAAGSIPARGPSVAFFTTAPG